MRCVEVVVVTSCYPIQYKDSLVCYMIVKGWCCNGSTSTGIHTYLPAVRLVSFIVVKC
jgi:hypothetical protein